MRNASTFDDDVDFEPPARKAAARKPRGATRKKKSRRFAIDMSKVARYAAIGMTATVGTGIIVNALMMQKGHHPAPLFGRQVALVDAPTPRAVPPGPPMHMPIQTAPPASPEAAEADGSTGDIPVPPAKPRRDGAAAPGDDAIARLLKASTGPAAGERTEPKLVLGVQQALVKLGFVLKPNGTFGPATKKAIETFEKDRHLPVKGEISHRLVKILSAESRVKID